MLGNGELLEFDSPNALLSDSESHFSSLVQQTGPREATHLRMLAKNASSKMKSTDQKLNDNKEDDLSSDMTEQDPLIV